MTSPRSKNRGSLIIAALLLFTLLLSLGLGLMSSQSARMKVARSQTEAAKAKELCLAAWQDVRVKLGTDLLFPPSVATQQFYAYSEDVFDSDNEFYGTYTVAIDIRYERFTRNSTSIDVPAAHNLSQGIYIITCTGKVGERAYEPVSERVMVYEVDMTTFDVIRVQDRGSL